jgi:predicted transcriptional regulator
MQTEYDRGFKDGFAAGKRARANNPMLNRMDELNMSLMVFAQRAGISRQYCYMLVSGHIPNPTIKTVMKLAKGLEVDPATVFEWIKVIVGRKEDEG